jgi:hypothetical protein
MMTIGINYVYKVIQVAGVKIKMQIWDTAGQDKYKTITQNYYRNSQGVLIVFAVDSRDSFRSVSTLPLIQLTGLKISQKQSPPPPKSSSSATKSTSPQTVRSPQKRHNYWPNARASPTWSAVQRVDSRYKLSSPL